MLEAPAGFASGNVAGGATASAAAGSVTGGGGGMSGATIGIIAGAGAGAAGFALAAGGSTQTTTSAPVIVTTTTVPAGTTGVTFLGSNPPPGSTISLATQPIIMIQVEVRILASEQQILSIGLHAGAPPDCAGTALPFFGPTTTVQTVEVDLRGSGIDLRVNCPPPVAVNLAIGMFDASGGTIPLPGTTEVHLDPFITILP